MHRTGDMKYVVERTPHPLCQLSFCPFPTKVSWQFKIVRTNGWFPWSLQRYDTVGWVTGRPSGLSACVNIIILIIIKGSSFRGPRYV